MGSALEKRNAGVVYFLPDFQSASPHYRVWVEGQGPHSSQDSLRMFPRVNRPALELGTKVLIQ